MRVLELGPGGNPDIRTTHAIDYLDKAGIVQLAKKQELKADTVPKEVITDVIWKHINSINYSSLDFNTQRFPFPDNYFDLVVSHFAMNSWGKIGAYREAARVLKKGKRIEIHCDVDRALRTVSTRLIKAGFGDIRVDKRAPLRNIWSKHRKKYKCSVQLYYPYTDYIIAKKL